MVNNSATAGSVGGKPDSTASTTSTGASVDEKTVPKDARVMISILKDMGISDFEPRVVNQLLEFSYRYVSTILKYLNCCKMVEIIEFKNPENPRLHITNIEWCNET